MSKSVFILVLTAISYGESIVDRPRLPTPPVPIAISSSESPLLSFTPVRWMDTANFINVKVRVCYSFSKHNIFSTKAIESFIIVWYRRRDPSRKPATRSFDSTFKISLTFASNTKTTQMAREEVAEVSYCYYSRDSREIVRKFPCLEAAKFTDRDRTFWDVLPAARADVFGHCARQRVNRHPILQLYNRYTGDSPTHHWGCDQWSWSWGGRRLWRRRF